MEIAKLKGQNVIKYLLLIVFLFTSNYMFCQKKISGIYSSLMPHQEHYNYFDFNTNGTFEYHSGASLGDDEFGKGYYQIKNDSLILNYDLTELDYKSYHKTKEYYNSKDLIKIEIVIKDFEGHINTNANIYIPNDRIGYVQGKDGFVAFNFKKENKEVSLEVSNLGYEFYKLKLSKLKNYKIEVFLNQVPNISKAIKNETEKYKILEYHDDIIKLKNNSRVMDLIKQSK